MAVNISRVEVRRPPGVDSSMTKRSAPVCWASASQRVDDELRGDRMDDGVDLDPHHARWGLRLLRHAEAAQQQQ
jgi:hypothetical protein